MRSSFFLLAFALFAPTAACTVTTGTEEVPTFTADDVRPSIEGKWKGTITEGGTSKPIEIDLRYVKGGVTTQCSNRTLSEPSALRVACVDVSTLNLAGDLTLDGETLVLNGSFLVGETKYQNHGEVSLQAQAKSDTRVDGVLSNGKIEGNLTRGDGKNISVVLAR